MQFTRNKMSLHRPLHATSVKCLSISSLTAVPSDQASKILQMMNQYELTDTLPSFNPSSLSSFPSSFRICECYLTGLICQQPSSSRFLSVCLPQPPDPSLLLSHQCQQRWRGCCACLTRRKLKNLEMNLSTAKVHTGATLLSAQGMAVKVSSFTPLLMWHPGAQGAYPGQGGLRGILSLENILSCCSLSILNVSIFIIVYILFLFLSLTHYKDYCPVRDNKELYYCCDKFHTRGA